jgi:hypothetical protein
MNSRIAVWLVALAVFALACEKKAENPEEPAKAAEPAEPAPPAAPAEVKLGMALAGAEEVPVEDLLKNPAAFEGKTVRVSGEVKDFCHHRRAWFGVSTKDGQQMVRVFAAPRFQAPADCKGKTVVAEGKVELITIKPEDAQHYAKEHKFLSKEEIESGKPITRPLIRAFGAEFK